LLEKKVRTRAEHIPAETDRSFLAAFQSSFKPPLSFILAEMRATL